MSRKISDSTVRRLSLYLGILERMERDGVESVASEALASAAVTTAAQVRKDLSLFGSFGKRGFGYSVSALVAQIREIMGLDRRWTVALVGAGRIGRALYEYAGFRDRGFDVVAILDSDPNIVGMSWRGVTVTDSDRLEEIIAENGVEMVVLAIPASEGQAIVDRAVAAGVKGILNFAPVQLRLPDGVELRNVNLVMELEALAFSLSQAAAE